MFERWFKCWNPWNPWNPWNFGCGNFFQGQNSPTERPPKFWGRSLPKVCGTWQWKILETSIQFADFPAMFDENQRPTWFSIMVCEAMTLRWHQLRIISRSSTTTKKMLLCRMQRKRPMNWPTWNLGSFGANYAADWHFASKCRRLWWQPKHHSDHPLVLFLLGHWVMAQAKAWGKNPGKRLQIANLKNGPVESSLIFPLIAWWCSSSLFVCLPEVYLCWLVSCSSCSRFPCSQSVTLRTPHPFFSSEKFPETNLGTDHKARQIGWSWSPPQDVERTQLESENYWTSRGKMMENDVWNGVQIDKRKKCRSNLFAKRFLTLEINTSFMAFVSYKAPS